MISFIDYSSVIRDLLIDLTSLYLFAYVILYRKFQNTEMFVSCTYFNIFILLIVMAIIRTDFNIAVGFGLFALLSLIQLRSVQFTKTEIAYLFGAVALGVINGSGISDLSFILIANFAIVLSAWIVGTWSLEHSANLMMVDNVKKMSVTLDQINTNAVRDRAVMARELNALLGIDIRSFVIKRIDYVRDVVDVDVFYAIPKDEKPQYVDSAVQIDRYNSNGEISDAL